MPCRAVGWQHSQAKLLTDGLHHSLFSRKHHCWVIFPWVQVFGFFWNRLQRLSGLTLSWPYATCLLSNETDCTFCFVILYMASKTGRGHVTTEGKRLQQSDKEELFDVYVTKCEVRRAVTRWWVLNSSRFWISLVCDWLRGDLSCLSWLLFCILHN